MLTSDIDSITYKKTDVAMDITVEVDQENATVSVVSSDKEQTYVAYLVLKE